MLTKLCVKTQIAIYSFMKDRQGVTAIEYAVIGVAVATALAVIFNTGTGSSSLKGALETAMKTISGKVSGS